MEGEGCIGAIILLLVVMFILGKFTEWLASVPSDVWAVLGAVAGLAGVALLVSYLTRHNGLPGTTARGELVTRDDPPMQMPREEAIARALAEHREIKDSTLKVNEALEKRAALGKNATAAQVHALTQDLNPGEMAVFMRRWQLIIDNVEEGRPPHQKSRPPTPDELKAKWRSRHG